MRMRWQIQKMNVLHVGSNTNMKRNWLTKEWLMKEFGIIGTTIKKVAGDAECDEKTIRRSLKWI